MPRGQCPRSQHVEEGGNGPQGPSRAHANRGDVAHYAHVGLERAIHIVGAAREVEEHVAGEHQKRGREAESEQGDGQRHGSSKLKASSIK